MAAWVGLLAVCCARGQGPSVTCCQRHQPNVRLMREKLNLNSRRLRRVDLAPVLAELLERVTPERVYREADFSGPRGFEAWWVQRRGAEP